MLVIHTPSCKINERILLAFKIVTIQYKEVYQFFKRSMFKRIVTRKIKWGY